MRPSFPPKLTQLSILPGLVEEYQRLLGSNLPWVGVPSRGSQRLSSINTTETGDKRRLHGPLARKGFSSALRASEVMEMTSIQPLLKLSHTTSALNASFQLSGHGFADNRTFSVRFSAPNSEKKRCFSRVRLPCISSKDLLVA